MDTHEQEYAMDYAEGYRNYDRPGRPIDLSKKSQGYRDGNRDALHDAKLRAEEYEAEMNTWIMIRSRVINLVANSASVYEHRAD